MAQRDAVRLGLGEYDEKGQFYITVPAEIETERTPYRVTPDA
jgi:hypothetical protein